MSFLLFFDVVRGYHFGNYHWGLDMLRSTQMNDLLCALHRVKLWTLLPSCGQHVRRRLVRCGPLGASLLHSAVSAAQIWDYL